MSADLYRDAHVGIVARLVELQGRIREREAEVTDEFWASLDAHVRERLEELRLSLDLAPKSFEQAAHAEGQLATYLEELERQIARAPAVEEEWRQLPDQVADPPRPSESWELSFPHEIDMQELRRSFVSTVRERDRSAVVVDDTRHSFLARFRDRRSPFSLRATAEGRGGHIAEVLMCLVTSVPRAIPKLSVRPESLMMAFGKALGVKHEIEVGEPSFDGLFLIEGTREAAARLLTPAMRSLLLSLSRFDVPTFEIDPPRRVASLKWRFEPVSSAFDLAVRILATVRAMQTDVRFRR